MATFTTPTINEVPPVPVAEYHHGPNIMATNPQGARLMRWYSSRPRGVAIFKMNDGTYQSARAVPGLTVGNGGIVAVGEPYPAVPEFPSDDSGGVGVPNDALGWYNEYEQWIKIPLDQPTVAHVYWGGTSTEVSDAEANALSAAGFGAYLS